MPNPNAVVSTTIEIESSRAQRDAGRDRGADIAVTLDGARRVFLVGDDGGAGQLRDVLATLAEHAHPVYLEVDPGTERIARVVVPIVGRVVEVQRHANRLEVVFDGSHAVHVVELDGADGAEHDELLRTALDAGTSLIVSADDGRRVLDLRPAPDGIGGGPLPFPKGPLPEPPSLWPIPIRWLIQLVRPIWMVIRLPWWWLRAPSATRAQQAFDSMAATTCVPLTTPVPCIPFLYPDDGCWGRAHEMCRLLIQMGLSPRKVWIDHSPGHWLVTPTKNHPQCQVVWGWHVAPTLVTKASFPFVRTVVVDPSLFSTPVIESTWKSVQGDPGATLTATPADQFAHGAPTSTDPSYSNTASVLATYRAALRARSLQVGPPPYNNC